MKKVYFSDGNYPIVDKIWRAEDVVEVAMGDLELSGVEWLGSGSFASAYSHRSLPNKIIRVGYTEDDGTWNPHAHKDFVQLARRSKSRLYPKYFHLSSVETGDGVITVTVMEKLEPVLGEVSDEIDYRFRCALENYISGYYPNQWCQTLTDCARTLKWSYDELRNIRRQALRANVEFNDVHSGNIMLRKTKYGKEFVFTDPVA